jgi:hypothetical protein
MASFVRIVLHGAGSYAKMETRTGDDIGDLVERACAKFPHWGGTTDALHLYLVAAGDDEEPTEEAAKAAISGGGRLKINWSLSRAGVSAGAWLVAQKHTASGASCLS